MRVVLDTNIVASALLFEHGSLAWMRGQWAAGQLTPLVSRPCVDELLRVLAYPKFDLTSEEIQIVLTAYLPFAEVVEPVTTGSSELPTRSDPADQKFLELAQQGNAEILVTGDSDLLQLSGSTSFYIVSPAEFRERYE